MRLIFIILLPLSIFPQSLEKISLNSVNYLITDYINIENGESPPFFTRPYISGRQLKRKHIIKPILNISIRAQYLNRDIEDKDLSYWYNRWLENDPLLNLGFIAGMENFLIYTDFDIRHDFFGGFNSSTYLNLPYRDYWYQDFDFNFPIRGYLIFGNRNLNLLVGRDKLQFGPGQKGSLMISSESPFFNQLKLTYSSKKFQASYFFIPLESFLSKEEKRELEDFFLSDSSLIPAGNFGKDISDQSKYLTGHRFEIKPNNSMILSFTDMLVVGGRFPNFEDISPSMFYHNVYGENYSNVMIGFDFFWVPIRNLGVYGEFIIDDIRNDFENKFSVPTSLGYLGGLRYNIPNKFTKLVFNFETAYIDPFTYLRWHPYTSFYTRRKYISTSINENLYLDSPIGFFLGPDSNFFSVWITAIYNKSMLSVGWEYRSRAVIPDLTPEEFIISYSENIDRKREELNSIYIDLEHRINRSYSINFKEEILVNNNILNILTLSFNMKF